MPKRSAEDVWRQLVDEAGEDAIERAASVSVAQAEKDLSNAGFDVAAERAKADALMRELEAHVSGKVAIAAPAREPPMAPVTRLPKPERQKYKWPPALVATTTLVVGAAIAVLLAVILPRIRHDEITAHPEEGSTSNPKARAIALRRSAADACQEHRWNECRQALDDAQELDPAGEETPEVRTLRNTIQKSTPPTPLPNPSPGRPDIKDKGPDTK